MAMNTVRRIAAQVIGVGENKVRFKPEANSKIGEALTREDVRTLIKDGSIYAIAPRGVSRMRGREKAAQAKKGRRGGKGSKKGTHAARQHPKTHWIAKVRSQRLYLRTLMNAKKIPAQSYRKIYLMIKGNAFKGVKFLETYLKDNKLMK